MLKLKKLAKSVLWPLIYLFVQLRENSPSQRLKTLEAVVRYLLLPDSESYQRYHPNSSPGHASLQELSLWSTHQRPCTPTEKPVRILYIGNIANNAYLSAKILNGAGFDCDVLCYDYYHVMGCPEWEDADFTGSVNENAPKWETVDLQDFQRPRWFAQGPLRVCINYLRARRKGQLFPAGVLW